MTNRPLSPREERLLELLADELTGTLTPGEVAELAALSRELPHLEREMERAAAATALAGLGRIEPMPEALAQRIETNAIMSFSQPPQAKTVPMPGASPPVAGPPPVHPPHDVSAFPARPERDFVRWSGWLVAAACIVLAAVAWLTRRPAPIANVPPVTSVPSARTPDVPPTPAPPPGLAELREKLLARADAVKAEWTATKDPAAKGATGDLVWSPVEQKGFMRFRGLASNDPTKSQYQLWIFDKAQDQKTPIDGGVFDVESSTGEVIVPISAKLHVVDPTLFAVTVEKPGGVVVSKRERIVVTAAPKS
jgi:hypothetical protein